NPARGIANDESCVLDANEGDIAPPKSFDEITTLRDGDLVAALGIEYHRCRGARYFEIVREQPTQDDAAVGLQQAGFERSGPRSITEHAEAGIFQFDVQV